MRKALPLPRYIRPENLAIGDMVRVEYPPVKGIVRTMTGTIASREYQGSLCMLSTAEDAVLVAFVPGHHDGSFRVVVLSRRDAEHTQLEGMEL